MKQPLELAALPTAAPVMRSTTSPAASSPARISGNAAAQTSGSAGSGALLPSLQQQPGSSGASSSTQAPQCWSTENKRTRTGSVSSLLPFQHLPLASAAVAASAAGVAARVAAGTELAGHSAAPAAKLALPVGTSVSDDAGVSRVQARPPMLQLPAAAAAAASGTPLERPAAAPIARRVPASVLANRRSAARSKDRRQM